MNDTTARDILASTVIVQFTSHAFGFNVTEVTGPSLRQPLAWSRQVGMYLCRELTTLSVYQIGVMFGGRHRTTVVRSIEKVNGVMRSDREIFDKVTRLTHTLRPMVEACRAMG